MNSKKDETMLTTIPEKPIEPTAEPNAMGICPIAPPEGTEMIMEKARNKAELLKYQTKWKDVECTVEAVHEAISDREQSGIYPLYVEDIDALALVKFERVFKENQDVHLDMECDTLKKLRFELDDLKEILAGMIVKDKKGDKFKPNSKVWRTKLSETAKKRCTTKKKKFSFNSESKMHHLATGKLVILNFECCLGYMIHSHINAGHGGERKHVGDEKESHFFLKSGCLDCSDMFPFLVQEFQSKLWKCIDGEAPRTPTSRIMTKIDFKSKCLIENSSVKFI
eukprot:TRINITY_DN1135_c1_g1_i4.p1 TRINITY_DN1135_c1_g1~~TRINITY_DN1135_c1_g1_i4.p1  ORF type:complete len:281 (-),score=58.29 TRINITY_DN1135_c1_g1_i4:421-1263(-)